MKRLLKNKKNMELITIVFILIVYVFIAMKIIETIEKENNNKIGCYCTIDSTFCPGNKGR